MTLFVLDASVTLAWFLDDEPSPYADGVASILDQGAAVAPVIWQLEVTNAFLSAVRRKRLLASDPPRFLWQLQRLRIDIDEGLPADSLGRAVFDIGLTHGLSAYDANYLELALRRGLPLATQDARLATAAERAGVEIIRP